MDGRDWSRVIKKPKQLLQFQVFTEHLEHLEYPPLPGTHRQGRNYVGDTGKCQ